MNSILENFAATTKSNLEAFEDLTTLAHANFEKLAELNLAASKAALTESFSHAQSALDAKDPQQFAALQSGVFTELTEKFAVYAQHVQSIFTEAGADFTQATEARTAEMQKAFADMMANLSKNAPVGSEAAVAAFTGAFASGQKALELANTQAKKAIEVAQSNYDAATKQTTDVVKTATKVAA
jgi:phasin family protein